jgi:nitrite reductase (NADH) small subunit
MSMREWLVGGEHDFAEDERRLIEVEGKEIAVVRIAGRFHAFENRCLHQGGPVAEGLVLGRVEALLDDEQRLIGERFSDKLQLVCPWHGWAYDLETGTCAGDPRRRLSKHPVTVREGQVYVHA